MQEWYLGCGKGVLFREVSSFQACPYRDCIIIYSGISIVQCVMFSLYNIPAVQGTQLHTNHRQQ